MSNRLLILFAWSCLVASVLPVAALAQSQMGSRKHARTGPNLYIDYGRFRSEKPDRVRLEIYYQILNRGLEFKAVGKVWQARYEVDVAVFNKSHEQVATYKREKRISAPSEAKARSKFNYRTSQVSFDLIPGKYDVEFTVRDLTSHRSSNREFNIKLKLFDHKQPTVSDVEFVQSAGQIKDSSSVFRKGNLQVVPAVSRSFGGDADERMLYYIEIYPGTQERERVNVETRLRHRSKGLIYRDTLYTDLNANPIRQLRQISLEEFPPGDYEMEVLLLGRRNKKLAHRRSQFEVLWNQEALVKFDWKTVVDQLSYIAEPGELKGFKKLGTVAERQEAFDEFWRKRDPINGTVENEAKQAFYRRVGIANRRFSILRREGWRTDRGRVYIRFGEPDEIDDFPYAPNSPPYQIWQYYTSGRYRRFTFVDEDEDGDYRLQYPYDGLYQRPDF